MNSNHHLTFVPSGGLANRMRAIASAVNLSSRTGATVEIVWFKGWGMPVGFTELFEAVNLDNVVLREAKCIDKLTVDRARRKNLYLTRLYQRLYFSGKIEEKQLCGLNRDGFDYEKWVLSGKNSYMSCYHKFGRFEDYPGIIRTLFTPLPAIKEIIDSYKNQFAPYTVGLHIRRTDNISSIQNSSLEKFYAVIEKEVAEHPDVCFFLATDDESVKTDLCSRYLGKIITSKRAASRELSGIRDGVAEMWTLASTSKIYGSFGSSYSEMAAVIGGIELIVVS